MSDYNSVIQQMRFNFEADIFITQAYVFIYLKKKEQRDEAALPQGCV